MDTTQHFSVRGCPRAPGSCSPVAAGDERALTTAKAVRVLSYPLTPPSPPMGPMGAREDAPNAQAEVQGSWNWGEWITADKCLRA